MSEDADACRHCGKRIVFEPYYLDGKPGPNPPIWFHPPGVIFCWSADETLVKAAPKEQPSVHAVMAEEIEEAT